MSYSNSDRETVEKIINKIEPANKFVQYEIKNNVKNFENAKLILIFLTKINYESNEIKLLIEKAKSKMKLILIFWIDKNDFDLSLNEFQVISLHNEMDLDSQLLALERLQSFMARVIGFETQIESSLKLNSIKMTRSHLFDEKYEKISNDEVLMNRAGQISPKLNQPNQPNQPAIYSTNTGQLISKIDKKGKFYWINHLNQILVLVDIDRFKIQNSMIHACLYDKKSDYVRDFDFDFETIYSKGFIFKSFVYNRKNKESYLHIEQVAADSNGLIFIYDENFDFKQKIELVSYLVLTSSNNMMTNEMTHEIMPIQNILLDYRIHENEEYPNIMFLQSECPFGDIVLLCKNSSSIISRIKTKYKLHKITKNKIMLTDLKGNFFIYNLKIGKNLPEYLIDKYTCKLNTFDNHLYKDPFLLPCGNSACNVCIFNHVNFQTGIFKCNFQSCQQIHKLPNRLNKDLVLIEEMKTNIEKILERMIQYGNNLISDPEKNIEKFEKLFDYLEHVIDIRKISLEDELEKQEENLIEKINNFERMKISTNERFVNFHFYDIQESLIKSNIGIFYDEFNNKEFFTSREPVESKYENYVNIIQKYFRELEF